MCSDHFAPWSARQGHSGFAWSWLGAALATTSLPFGVVNAPGQRYHPAIIAQASATLAAMFPGRFWVGARHPARPSTSTSPATAGRRSRSARPACSSASRSSGRCTPVRRSPTDGLVHVDRARIWSLPDEPPPLVGAAVSAETAAVVRRRGPTASITVNQPIERAPAGARRLPRAPAGGASPPSRCTCRTRPTTQTALAVAHDQWRNGVARRPRSAGTRTRSRPSTPCRELVRPEDLREAVLVSERPRASTPRG